MAKVLGTIKRGKVKIRSRKQIGYLEHHNLPYTSFKRGKGGKIVKKRQNVK